MLIFAGVSATGCVDGQTPREAPAGAEVPLPASRRAGKETRDAGVPAGVRALTEAYPDFFDRNSFKDNTLTTKDGTRLTWDDGREKDFVGRLDDCDIEDMFVGRYYVPDGEPAYLSDVGRGRNDKLFKTMYGSSAAEVTRNLVNVKWADGKTVRFTRVNGAADSLSGCRTRAVRTSRASEVSPLLGDILLAQGARRRPSERPLIWHRHRHRRAQQ